MLRLRMDYTFAESQALHSELSSQNVGVVLAMRSSSNSRGSIVKSRNRVGVCYPGSNRKTRLNLSDIPILYLYTDLTVCLNLARG